MRPFNFQPPNDLLALQANSREFLEKSSFGTWNATTSGISNVDSIRAQYQLYGTLGYYYIDIAGSAPTLSVADGVTAYVTNPPFGPMSVSGGKATYNSMPLLACAQNGTNLVSNTPCAFLMYNAGVPNILLPTPSGTTISASHIYISGWFIRD